MVSIKIIKEEPITMSELKDELDLIKKRDKELSFRANKTDEYLNQFSEKNKEAKELVKKILKLDIPRLKLHHIVKIIDIMPKTINDLKIVLQGYTLTINSENMKKIIDVLSKE